jgi:hypothetical protein
MLNPSSRTSQTQHMIQEHARVCRATHRPTLSPQATHSIAVALQYVAATTCLAVLTWIVMLMVYAPFIRMQ